MKNKKLWKLLTNSALSLVMGFSILPTTLAVQTESDSKPEKMATGSGSDNNSNVKKPSANQQTSATKRSLSAKPASTEPPTKRPREDALQEKHPSEGVAHTDSQSIHKSFYLGQGAKPIPLEQLFKTIPPVQPPAAPLPPDLQDKLNCVRSHLDAFHIFFDSIDLSAQNQLFRVCIREFLEFARRITSNEYVANPYAYLLYALNYSESNGGYSVDEFKLDDLHIKDLAPYIAKAILRDAHLFKKLDRRAPLEVIHDVIDCISNNYGDRDPHELRVKTARYLIDIICDFTHSDIQTYHNIYIIEELLQPLAQQ